MRELRFILARQKPSKTDILFAPLLLKATSQLVKRIIATFASLRDVRRALPT
jgi:hypothetical protein